MAVSNNVKRADRHIPFMADQGVPQVVGAAAAGVSIQRARVTMPADGVVLFSSLSWANMADGNYLVIASNHTSSARPVTAADNARLWDRMTLAGPSQNDLLDVIVVGKLYGQLA